MTDLEYLEKAKDGKLDWDVIRQVCEHEIEYRKMKALEIIAGKLIKIDLNLAVLTSVIEGVTNQGRSVNVDARVSEIK